MAERMKLHSYSQVWFSSNFTPLVAVPLAGHVGG